VAVATSKAARPLPIRLLRFLSGLVLAAVIGVTAAIAFSAIMRVQARTLPAVSGPSAVGRVELALADASRADPFAGDGRQRELAVWIWYPAATGAAGPPAPYVPAAWTGLVNNEGLFSQDLASVRTNAMAGVPLDGRPPVVVLLPGLSEPVASYTALAEDLASHGYAVVGINPTGSTSVAFPDGRVSLATAAGNVSGADVPSWYTSAERVTTVWVEDVRFVLRTLEATPPTIGGLDFGQVAFVGHSLGGAAAFEACHQFANCAAAVDLDGTLWTEVRRTGLEGASLIVRAASGPTCDAFCQASSADFATVDAVGDSTQFSVAGSTHMNYSDMGLLWRPLGHLVTLGSIDSDRMVAITRGLVRAFLDEHVRDAAVGSFAATAAGFEEVR
jgi:pimeloyl-ACP methyl ester carboxylesterase